ncbi:MAG: hypothetical protein ACXW1M_08455 [Acidimicrobiia bacterium]
MHTERGPVPGGAGTAPAEPFGGAVPGTRLGPLPFAVSQAANERYWRSAGVEHPLLEAGALYPPIAANLTILLFQTVAPRPLLHTRQRLVCHRSAAADQDLEIRGTVVERFARRDREYAVVEAEITVSAERDQKPLWTSIATFCEVQ